MTAELGPPPHDCLPGRTLVVREGVCSVERCACGTIYLTLGALSLRMHVDALASLSDLLGEAVRRLGREASVTPEKSKKEPLPS
jgi:hypothetical protein